MPTSRTEDATLTRVDNILALISVIFLCGQALAAGK
jgi:hypothetical protein